MTDPLGYQPIKRPLILSLGADFGHILRPATGTYPAGTTSRIVISNDAGTTLATWTATTSTTQIEYTIQNTETDLIPDRSKYRLYIVYPGTPATDFLVFYGLVQRKQ